MRHRRARRGRLRSVLVLAVVLLAASWFGILATTLKAVFAALLALVATLFAAYMLGAMAGVGVLAYRHVLADVDEQGKHR